MLRESILSLFSTGYSFPGGSFLSAVVGPLKTFFTNLFTFVIYLVVMVIILVIGFIIASIIQRFTLKLLDTIGFNNWSDKVGLTSILQKGEVRIPPSQFVSLVFYWFLVTAFLIAGLASIDLEMTNTIVSVFFMFLPRFLSAILVLILGYLFSSFLARATLLAGVNAGLKYSRLLAEAVRLLMLIFIFAMALEQLGLATGIVVAAFSILFGGILLALAIAFGLGGKDVAKKILEGNMAKEEEKDDIQHL